MRPRVDDTAVRVLLNALPEFEPNYLDLVEVYDEDLTPQVVFSELAEMVSNLLEDEAEEELIENCFLAIETVATAAGVDVTEVVGYAFLDGLRPTARDRIEGWLGPVTTQVLEDLDAGVLDLADPGLSVADIADMQELEDRGAVAPGTTARVLSLAAERAAPPPPQ